MEEIKKEVEKKDFEKREMSEKEARIRAITRLYYSNPQIQKILLEFARNREVVPRYFEGFGKRPDTLQYPSDIQGLVNKGATSFHASEEVWDNPLDINTDLSVEQLSQKRKGWDLLIDIDSKYLDYSKIAAILIINALEAHGIKKYGIKFSGSKGFHIIVSGKAFPRELNGELMREKFPDWPRAICQYITAMIKPEYNRRVAEKINFDSLELRTNLKKEDVTEVKCPNCGKPAESGKNVTFTCPRCRNTTTRINPRITKKGVRCIDEKCLTLMEITKEEECYFCTDCKISNISKVESLDKTKNIVYTKFARESRKEETHFEENISDDILGGLDLVLVAPRHLFRMPYSLHEKTALVSAVLFKEEIENFVPGDAHYMKMKIREFVPQNEENEGINLLVKALDWKKKRDSEYEKAEAQRYAGYNQNISIERGEGRKEREGNVEYKEFDFSGVREDDFPPAIKKLLKGLADGRKRGLFVLITFLRSINYSPEKINEVVKEWNKKNAVPLKEGYIKSQIDWNIRQKRKILPPNYDNDAFYKDLGLIDKKQDVKNPLVDVMRNMRRG